MRQWKIMVLVLGFWLCIVLYTTISVPSDLDAANRAEHTLAKTMEELSKLSEQNKELQKPVLQFKNERSLQRNAEASVVKNLSSRFQKASNELSKMAAVQNSTLSLTHEEEYARRKVVNTATELWYFLEAQLKKIEDSGEMKSNRISKLKKDLQGYRRTMLDDLDRIRKANKAEQWRLQKSEELGDLVQRRLEYLQNPTSCENAKRIHCDLFTFCGFGCEIHHITHCLIAAYALERTLILTSSGWRYSPKGWESVFMPLSEKCTTDHLGGSRIEWGSASMEQMMTYDIIDLPIAGRINPPPDFMPLSVPADLASELSVFHGNPAVWWIGQIIRFLFRLQPNVLEDVLNAGKKMGFTNTIVGVQVRRTDKIDAEAKYHSLEEYMHHVQEFYDQRERTQPGITRNVYLASDDPEVLAEATMKYPQYNFISDNRISQSASLGTRYTNSSLLGIIIDIYYLARCDFLVCTFSSNVCRVAYEIMQTMHGDASSYFNSLDDIFYFGGQNAHNWVAVEAHNGTDEFIDILPGDQLGIAGNHWDGNSKGMNRRTKLSGVFPSYKAEDFVVPVQMPIYPMVPRKRS